MGERMETRPKEPKITPKKGKVKFEFQTPTEAPVIRMTDEDFAEPWKFLQRIRPMGEKTGILRLIPPENWKPPFALKWDELLFSPRIQRINELEASTRIKLNFIDLLTKFFAERGKTFQIPTIEKKRLDLYTLHRLVKDHGGVDEVNKAKKWNELAFMMGFSSKNAGSSLKHNYDDLITPFLLSQKTEERRENLGCSRSNDKNSPNYLKSLEDRLKSGKLPPTLRELRSLRFLGPGPKMPVCEDLQENPRTRGKKMNYEFDPLAKYLCKSCLTGDIEEEVVVCTTCNDRYHSSCLIPRLEEVPDNWRCPKCVATEVYKPLEDFGFAQTEKVYTLSSFKAMADDFKKKYFKSEPTSVSTSQVEQEFWRVVTSIEESVQVEYGADLHVIHHGSGFPRTCQPRIDTISPEEYDKYANCVWNLNNLPVQSSSILKYISADISGMKIPWMYAGMCFSTFCWHNEDHWSYSINYLHMGEPKTWYGVPGNEAERFEKAMKNAAPELFASQPDLLHQLVTIMNPNVLMRAGVPVYRTDQHAGEFVITFPRAYHAGFNQGFNFAEACNFAPADWLEIGRECISHYSSLKRPCVFSHDELVVSMALNADDLEREIAEATLKDMIAMVNAEMVKWKRAVSFGVTNVVDFNYETVEDDERVCAECNTTVFLSGVVCACEQDKKKLVCLEHVHKLCYDCKPSDFVVRCHHRINLLKETVEILKNKLYKFENWKQRVENALSPKGGNKISLRALTGLLIEAKDKNFPQSDLIDLLEFQVRKSIDCSALARLIVGSGLKKKKAENKLTVDDIAMFYDEVLSLPCKISETEALKKLLDEALRFQRMASSILSKRAMPRGRISACIELGKNLELDLLELPLLESRLNELDWIKKAEHAVANSATLEETEALLNSCPDSKNVKISLAKEELKKLLKRINAINTEDDVEEVDGSSDSEVDDSPLDPIPFSMPVELSPSPLEKKIESVLKGDEVLFLTELEGLLSSARSQKLNDELIEQLRDGILQVTSWLNLGRKMFLKPSSNVTLMQALWPRRFEPRTLLFQNSLLKHQRNIESLIKDTYTKEYFEYSFKEQTESLLKLRLESLELNAQMDTKLSTVSCVCGEPFQGLFQLCELCKTAYHHHCMGMDERLKIPRFTGNTMKYICAYCATTKRPSFSSLQTLLDASHRMTLKVPECLALDYYLSKIKEWMARVKVLMDSRVFKKTLNTIVGCSNFNEKITLEKWTTFRKNLIKVPSRICQGVSLLPQVKVSEKNTTPWLAEVRYEIALGDMFEVHFQELEQLWTFLDIWESSSGDEIDFDGENPSTSRRKLTHRRSSVAKKSISKVRPSMPNLISHSTDLPSPAMLSQSLPVAPTVQKPRRKQVFTKGMKRKKTTRRKSNTSQPELSTTQNLEEHEDGDSCAAPDCSKPCDWNVKWVQCEGTCEQWFHMKCLNLKDDHLKDDVEFICPQCIEPAMPPFKKIKLPLLADDNQFSV